MADYLRNFGIGVINLLGVAVPGALLIGLATFGFLIPLAAISLNLSGNPLSIAWPKEPPWAEVIVSFVHISIAMFAVLSYVTGYILRLTSPNELDKASVEWMEKKNGSRVTSKAEMERKVTCGNRTYNDEFPYWGLGLFLETIGHKELSKYVTWTAVKPDECSTATVNMWKGDISLHCPDLASTINSEEAHVRLMSGTWQAIRTTRVAVGILGILTIAALVISQFVDPSNFKQRAWLYAVDKSIRDSAWFYAIQFSVSFFMFCGMLWAQGRIKMLFHKKRVGELLLVCHAKHQAEEQKAKKNV